MDGDTQDPWALKPILHVDFAAGFMSSGTASKTTLNRESYLLSIVAIFPASSSLLTIHRLSRTNARMIAIFTLTA